MMHEDDAIEMIQLEGLDHMSGDAGCLVQRGGHLADLSAFQLGDPTLTPNEYDPYDNGGGGMIPAPPELPPGFLYPGAVQTAAKAWESFDPPKYRLQWGDTFIGLATTYLGNPNRWREIYDLQPASARATKGTRGWIAGQDVINMPKEAARNMQKWLNADAPANVTPAEVNKSGAGDSIVDKVDKMSPAAKIALAAGAAALGYYLLA